MWVGNGFYSSLSTVSGDKKPSPLARKQGMNRAGLHCQPRHPARMVFAKMMIRGMTHGKNIVRKAPNLPVEA
jgi:hypothetical protein